MAMDAFISDQVPVHGPAGHGSWIIGARIRLAHGPDSRMDQIYVRIIGGRSIFWVVYLALMCQSRLRKQASGRVPDYLTPLLPTIGIPVHWHLADEEAHDPSSKPRSLFTLGHEGSEGSSDSSDGDEGDEDLFCLFDRVRNWVCGPKG
eukprot:1153936-Pelagomonas_calceolata.AAC.6